MNDPLDFGKYKHFLVSEVLEDAQGTNWIRWAAGNVKGFSINYMSDYDDREEIEYPETLEDEFNNIYF